MGTNTPRVVLVTRPTQFDLLVARHGTAAQANFFLETRGQELQPLRAADELQAAAVQQVTSATPTSWRRARVARDELARFLFEPDDIVVIVGQDGLVANTAKYLEGQAVIGLNPNPEAYAGVLVNHPPQAIADLLGDIDAGRARLQRRAMAEAVIEGGFRLRALNEIFVGHRTHQSARYTLRYADQAERQSSSGTIVATGTGSTGWARSIHRARQSSLHLPSPTDPRLVYFVREAFPSPCTGCTLTEGLLDGMVEITSEMNEGGVVFGDGIEADRIDFSWGQTVRIGVAAATLNLVR